MALDISNSEIGYDYDGVEALKTKIRSDLIETACTNLTNGASQVNSQIGEFWVGGAAEAFQQKLTSDTRTLTGKLSQYAEAIDGAIYQMGSNMEESDRTIASSINNI